jgi:cobalt transporter subunit CbtA
MTGRVVLAVILAGIAAGLIMGVIQHVRLTPLILQAESFERAGDPHSHAPAGDSATAGGHDHGDGHSHDDGHGHDHGEGWSPADGWQRTLATTVTAVMAGAAFAAVLAGLSLLTGLRITRQNGLVWGLCGFVAVSLAPAAGLPPELPGMAAAELLPRQIWWVCTIALTGAGLYLLAARREAWAIALAILVIALPHVIGAPAAPHEASMVPATLAASFAANSLAANAVFWSCIGLFLGLALDRYAKDMDTA